MNWHFDVDNLSRCNILIMFLVLSKMDRLANVQSFILKYFVFCCRFRPNIVTHCKKMFLFLAHLMCMIAPTDKIFDILSGMNRTARGLHSQLTSMTTYANLITCLHNHQTGLCLPCSSLVVVINDNPSHRTAFTLKHPPPSAPAIHFIHCFP